MLKDAALLHLELMEAALREGLILKDASPYNVQWRGTEPVFIDIGSFERHRSGEPWVGYRQFCMLFLNPLLMQAYKNLPFHPWLRGSIDGVTPTQARQLLAGARLRRGVTSHIRLHARLERRHADACGQSVKREMRKAGFDAELIGANVKRLAKLVRGLEWKSAPTAWTGYGEDNTYTDADADGKASFVRASAVCDRDRVVWDIGCNDGTYSRIAAETADHVIALDSDHATVERLYEELKREGQERILPLVMSVSDPSPGLGWRGLERRALPDRGKPDLVLCLALLHHVSITDNVPVREFLDWLRGLQCRVVIEFVTREDPMTQRLLSASARTPIRTTSTRASSVPCASSSTSSAPSVCRRNAGAVRGASAGMTRRDPAADRRFPSARAILIVLLLSAAPLAEFLDDNRGEPVGILDVLPYFAVLAGLGVATTSLALWLRGAQTSDRVAVAFGVGVYLFFSYNRVETAFFDAGIGGSGGPILVTWGVLMVALPSLAYFVAKWSAVSTFAATFGALLLVVFPLASFALHRAEASSSPASVADPGLPPVPEPPPAERPDVFYFIFDAYGSFDQVEKALGLRDERLSRTLVDSGFTVLGQATSSYPSTGYSLPSTLSMAYWDSETQDGIDSSAVIEGRNPVVRRFKELGYRYVRALPDSRGAACSGIEDLCVEPQRYADGYALEFLRDEDFALLGRTPIAGVLQNRLSAEIPSTSAHILFQDPTRLLDRLGRAGSEEPKFVFSHTLLPHEPYRFKANCATREPSEFASAKETDPSSKPLLAANYRCVNRLIRQVARRIHRTNPNAFVIFQGDHGSHTTVEEPNQTAAWTEAQVAERFSILNALRLPERCGSQLRNDLQAVNTFRVVFACIEGEDRSFYRSGSSPPTPTAGRSSR